MGGASADGPGAALVGGHPMPPLLLESTDPGLMAWRAELPRLVEELLGRWELRAEAPFVPGGSNAWVAPVRDAGGAELVLKVAWAHEESRDEAAGMAAWQGHGAAQVHRHERRGETAALLLERVRPGTPLAELLTWPERDEVVARIAQRLWKRPTELVGAEAAATFRPLAHMCAWWANRAQERAQERAAFSESLLPEELVQQGLALFRELPEQWDGEQVLLATDLHPSNVLSAEGPGGRHWVLIDPKPYTGDPHYDVLQHMFNDPDRLRVAPGAFAERMAMLSGLDPRRVRRWLFARCVQEAGELEGAVDAALLLAAEGVG